MSDNNKTAFQMTAALDIVDTQLHLSLDLTEDQIIASMDALGITSVIVDELWSVNEKMQGVPCVHFAEGVTRPLSPYAQAAALKHPERFSYIQRVDRRDPELAAHIAVLATTPECRALRLVLLHPAERQVFASGGYDTLLSLAQTYGLPVCVLAQDIGTLLANVAPRYPDLPFVLDHCGWPKSAEQWNDVLRLATHANTWLKWSHAFKPFFRGATPQQALDSEFLRAIEAFGANRIVWASDVTHEDTGASWSQLLSFVRDHSALSHDDKAWILGRTARQLFAWDATSPTTH
jgi:predicted TIM-barrel fold metal-dependent hydrolase